MPADRRLFDSSSMTPPPVPEIDAMTCNVETPTNDIGEVIFENLKLTPYEPEPWSEKPLTT